MLERRDSLGVGITRLYRKGKSQPAELYYMGIVLMDHRHGLPVDVEVTEADGHVARQAALAMLSRQPRARQQRTIAADKAYDTEDLVAACQERGVTPHVSQILARPGGAKVDGRTARHAGYQLSQRIRKRIEEGFGRGKAGRPLRKIKHTKRVKSASAPDVLPSPTVRADFHPVDRHGNCPRAPAAAPQATSAAAPGAAADNP